MQESVWIGLVGVVPIPSTHSVLTANAKGAYVNALAYVTDVAGYKTIVEQELRNLGLTPYEFEDIETFSERTSKWEVDAELRQLAEEVEVGGGVRFGTFYNYTGVE
jgi:hypothetical protein